MVLSCVPRLCGRPCLSKEEKRGEEEGGRAARKLWKKLDDSTIFPSSENVVVVGVVVGVVDLSRNEGD